MKQQKWLLQQDFSSSKSQQTAPSVPAQKDDCRHPNENILEGTMWWISEVGCSGEMSAQKCRQELLQNGHFWRQVWTWYTEQWNIGKLLPDFFTSFKNWSLKAFSIFIYLLLLAKFYPFDAICLVTICLELSNLNHIWNDDCYTNKKLLQIMFPGLQLNVNQTAIHTHFFLCI